MRNIQSLSYLRWTTTTILPVIFPETLQAYLRHLSLIGFALPIATRLLTTAVGLVTLCVVIHLLPTKYSAPMDFIHTPAGDVRGPLFIPYSQLTIRRS